ncbi:hypothetical protein BOC36_08570 [Burkholderia pseudomallei]|uniref:hypothetical protein n=1 Tax=Burkholderia pseudomallei TaxID=28450 RepID=UPI000A1A265F|nr:hypothetical protein [Burkholderia pseudomallei]ARK53180.1 hypothetical protein BOC36_08570 [Burkholderia pseudomallei]
MSHNSENGFFAMIERLWRAFMAIFWVAVMVLLPIVAVRGLYVAYRRKRAEAGREKWKPTFRKIEKRRHE